MRSIIINDILIPALERLYQVDYDNIHFGVSERNICARLAHHIENIMREYDSSHNSNYYHNYYADVEYNRMGNGNMKMYESNEKKPRYMVSDLLIHNRGCKRNYLAIEMKRKGNNRYVMEDMHRLVSMVSPSTHETEYNCVHDTLVGAFIVYGPNGVSIQLFEEINGNGQKTDLIMLSTNELN